MNVTSQERLYVISLELNLLAQATSKTNQTKEQIQAFNICEDAKMNELILGTNYSTLK
jgi:hypothetical protein